MSDLYASSTSTSPSRRSGERMIAANGVDICIETFGDPGAPALLLIHGATTPMHGWDDAFCERLAAGGRFVIRFDQRDTGQSVSYPPGSPGYGMPDLVADVAGIIDALGLERAHIAGISMGGGVALGAALEYPERIASLTLIATSPGGSGLPPMSEQFLAFIRQRKQPDWSDREALVDHIIAFMQVLDGPAGTLDEPEMRERLGFSIDRTKNIASSQINQFAMETGQPIRDRLGEVAIPALVIHDEHDPIFPPGHAEALAREIPGSELLVLGQSGHLLNRAAWDIVVPAMLAHTSGVPTQSEGPHRCGLRH